MHLTALTPATLRPTLSALRHPQSASPLHASPLLHLALVSAELAREDLADTPANRAWVLARLLDRLVRARLFLMRSAATDQTHQTDAPAHSHAIARPRRRPRRDGRADVALEAPHPEAERRQLVDDFRAGSIEREAWSLLYTRFLSPNALAMGDVQRLVGIGHSTAARRLQRGIDGLLIVLREREAALVRLDGAPHAAAAPSPASPVPAARVEPTAEGARGAAAQPPAIAAYLQSRVTAWSTEPYALDRRFVEPWLAAHVEERTPLGRLQRRQLRRRGLAAVLGELSQPIVIVVGAPGDGKSTLLRRCELELARGGGDLDAGANAVPFYVPLSRYGIETVDGSSLPAPRAWLEARWAARAPHLPPLAELLALQRAVLLLDALNEIPHASEAELAGRIRLWKRFAHEVAADQPGNRIVFSCRTADYFLPLSTPAQRVPQIVVEPFDDDQIRTFLGVALPDADRAGAAWQAIEHSIQVDLLRSPFFLQLIAAEVEANGHTQLCRTVLLSESVRRGIRREIERDNPLFHPGRLLTAQDYRHFAAPRNHVDARANLPPLPERGPLLPTLARLAHAVHARHADGDSVRFRVSHETAVALAGHADAAAIIRAAQAIGMIDDDPESHGVAFSHQLIQEYFVGRQLAKAPEPERVAAPWQADAMRPLLSDLVPSLHPADALPELPQTGWEESTLLAAPLSADPESFVRALLEPNLRLAARCALAPLVAGRIGDSLRRTIRDRLLARCSDAAADLRERIACGDLLGLFGDPRFERSSGACGDYMLASFVSIEAGKYPIGDDAPIRGDDGAVAHHTPRHCVQVSAYDIAIYPVTNAEWAYFIAVGGYDDARWWDTAAGGSWRADHRAGDGSAAPAYWDDRRFNRPNQPVIGICWFEALAYCRWLSATAGRPFRLPTEVEWEAAARGNGGRSWPSDDAPRAPDPIRANTAASHVQRTTPVGIFVESSTPNGVADLAGNTCDLTSSGWGSYEHVPDFTYPYDPSDGREVIDAPTAVRRVTRGGVWDGAFDLSRPYARGSAHAATRTANCGLRLACSSR